MKNKKYMEFGDIRLKQPLSKVKRSESGNSTLIVPANLIDSILQFFNAENIPYNKIENPSLYPQEKLDAAIKRYDETDPETFEDEPPVLLITQFDADALFEWSKQLYGETIDPSYDKYLEDRSKKADEYYRTQYEYRPD